MKVSYDILILEEIYNGFYVKEIAKNTEKDKGVTKEWVVFQDLKNPQYTYTIPLAEFLKLAELKNIKKTKVAKKRVVQKYKAYSHFKRGDQYYIRDIAVNPFTGEEFVIYQALYGEGEIWIRSYEMFCEKLGDGRDDNLTEQEYRFEILNSYKEKIM